MFMTITDIVIVNNVTRAGFKILSGYAVFLQVIYQ